MSPREMLVAPMAHMPPAKLLDGLAADLASAKPRGAPHSVAEILAHVVFWQTWFLERCEGKAVPMAASAADGWPAPDDWDALRMRFLADLDRAVAVGEDGGRLIDPPIELPPMAEYTVGSALTHVAMHNAHHLGQIVTLRQMLGAWPPPSGSWTW